jgi:pyruvate kinase
MTQKNRAGRKTKIIATIGPSFRSIPALKRMIDVGMNVARLNLSHGSYENHGEIINRIRALSKEMNKPVAILFDLQGPKIRTGIAINYCPHCRGVWLNREERDKILERTAVGQPPKTYEDYSRRTYEPPMSGYFPKKKKDNSLPGELIEF